MSILKTILLICDKCEESTVDVTSSSQFKTVKQVEIYMLKLGWKKKGKKHFCAYCYHIQENEAAS